MAKVYEHLSEEELEERYVACSNATASRHFVIWRLARVVTPFGKCRRRSLGERRIEHR